MSQQGEADSEAFNRQAVVVIHGLAAHRGMMLPLIWRIRAAGFRVANHGYRSFFKTVPLHAQRFLQRLRAIEHDDCFDQIHIVAHSLGGIITRQMLLSLEESETPLAKLRRVVLLAPPNAGSAAARRLSYFVPFSSTVRQISDRRDSFVRQLAEPSLGEIGVVEASYDFVVPYPTAQLQHQTDHVRIFSGHNGLLVRPAVAREVICFLKTGQFLNPDR